MQPFQEATWEHDPKQDEALITQSMQVYPHWTRKDAEKFLADTFKEPVFINDTYQVSTRKINSPEFGGEWIHLSIRRRDREPIHDWRAMQEIKNLLVGPENEGIELYPAESRCVDTANQFHIWVLKDPNGRFPIGFTERLILTEDQFNTGTKAKQRPFEKD